jgi:hypothetical protein
MVVSEKKPIAHDTQAVASAAEYFPELQAMHTVAPVDE